MNIQVTKSNTLKLERGYYASWLNNAISDANATILINEGAALLAYENDVLDAKLATDANGAVTGTVNPSGGVIGGITSLTLTRSTILSDNGATLTNSTASNFTITISANTIAQGTT